MQIGILGGTFDPIHFGHLLLAQEALEKLHLERVIFMPCYLPPHKYRRNMTDAKTRLKMVALAVKSNSKFSVSSMEIERKGKSYSIETLRQLKNVFAKSTKLFFITGSDSINELLRWKDFDEVRALVRFVIARRPHYPFSRLNKKMKDIRFIDITSLDISSSGIRRNLREKKSIEYLVPPEVKRFIVKNRLYR